MVLVDQQDRFFVFLVLFLAQRLQAKDNHMQSKSMHHSSIMTLTLILHAVEDSCTAADCTARNECGENDASQCVMSSWCVTVKLVSHSYVKLVSHSQWPL